jgi:hypothetical protein
MDVVGVSLQVSCSDLDGDGVFELTRVLADEIAELPVDKVDLKKGVALPPGGRAGEALQVGAILVTVSSPVIAGLMAVVSSWLSRQPSDVEVEIDGQRFKGRVSQQQRDELISAYLRRLDTEA